MAAPRTANITIVVGDKDVTINHSNFSSLSLTRTAKDVSDKFSLSILDNDAYEIEGMLLSGNNFIQVTYMDDDLKVYKTFSGYAYAMNSAFVNNRNMLTITGLVSASVNDKYEKYTFPWNLVPKFDWGEALGDANVTVYDANYDVDGGLDQFGQGLGQFFSLSGLGWKSIFTWNWNHCENYKEVIDDIFSSKKISVDKKGNYYIQKYKRSADSASEEKNVMTGTIKAVDEQDDIVKSNGCMVIPIRPHKLLKFICCGGKYSDLLEKEYTDYKGTAFYKSDISNAEWYYIQKWYKQMGTFKGLGFTSFECDYKTSWDESEYLQQKQSFMEFMYNFILPKCVYKKDNKKYTNFYLSFEGNKVKLARIDASKQPTNAPKYLYYGKFDDNGKNQGRMTSFEPTLDILTSMITNNTVAPGEGADLSGTNLAGGTVKSDITISASSKEADEGRYEPHWGVAKITTASKSSDKNTAENDVIKTFEKAAALSYRAKATIEGFNKLAPQDYIEITLVPKNSSGEPTHHHMSGIYFILTVEDTISDGKYTTKLDMIKNINKIGDTAVVESAEATVGELKYEIKHNYIYLDPNDSLLENQMKMNNPKNEIMF